MSQHRKPVMSNATFDVLKWVAQIALPAVGALYFALAGIWGLPNADEVVGTIVAVDAFLGVVLGLSTAKYNKSDAAFDGDFVVHDSADGAKVSLDLSTDPDQVIFGDQKAVRLKVQRREE